MAQSLYCNCPRKGFKKTCLVKIDRPCEYMLLANCPAQTVDRGLLIDRRSGVLVGQKATALPEPSQDRPYLLKSPRIVGLENELDMPHRWLADQAAEVPY
jgi:hypothetical protein